MTDADKDLAEAVPPDLVMPSCDPVTSFGGESEVLEVAAALDLADPECSPDPPLWLASFFEVDNAAKLIRIARRIGARSHGEAEEAVSAALADVACNASNILHPLEWTKRAIRSHLLRERRRFQRPRELAARGAGTSSVLDDLGLQVIEDIDWVLSVLATLPPKQRQAMNLYYDGHSVTEIAEDLGTTVSSVTSNLFLAKKKLRSHPDIATLHRAIAPDPPPPKSALSGRERARPAPIEDIDVSDQPDQPQSMPSKGVTR